MYALSTHNPGSGGGLGDVSLLGGFSLQTLLLMGAGGVILYFLFFGQPAKVRRGKLKEAEREYKARRKTIKRTYKRWGVKAESGSGHRKVKQPMSGVEREVVEALRGQGAGWGRAVAAVRKAKAGGASTGSFEPLFRAALEEVRR